MTKPLTASPLRVKVITQPTEELISIEDCRAHLEFPYYGDSDIDPLDDVAILDKLADAREYCEDFTGLVIARKTIEVALDDLPTGAVELPFGPLVSVTSVTIGEGSDAETVDEDDYTVDDYSKPPRLVPVTAWPTMTAATNTVKIRYIAGFGDDSDSLPLPHTIRAAMLFMLAHLWENREASTEKAMATIPLGVEAMLRPKRIRLGMA